MASATGKKPFGFKRVDRHGVPRFCLASSQRRKDSTAFGPDTQVSAPTSSRRPPIPTVIPRPLSTRNASTSVRSSPKYTGTRPIAHGRWRSAATAVPLFQAPAGLTSSTRLPCSSIAFLLTTQGARASNARRRSRTRSPGRTSRSCRATAGTSTSWSAGSMR